MKPIFVTGIDTGIGKTIASAVLVEKLKADYWKPIQSGDLDQSDTLKVQSLVSNTTTKFHPEAYRLTQPYSPHKSAALDGIEIDIDKIIPPKTSNMLLIEGAGGLMVPLNDRYLIIDLIEKLEAEVVLVSKNYLGSINHTLLSIEVLKRRNIPIKALIFNGNHDESSESYITQYSGLNVTFIPEMASVDKENVLTAAAQLSW
jgi:dethiobiotin synthetase